MRKLAYWWRGLSIWIKETIDLKYNYERKVMKVDWKWRNNDCMVKKNIHTHEQRLPLHSQFQLQFTMNPTLCQTEQFPALQMNKVTPLFLCICFHLTIECLSPQLIFLHEISLSILSNLRSKSNFISSWT